jgi:hypothetical protein
MPGRSALKHEFRITDVRLPRDKAQTYLGRARYAGVTFGVGPLRNSDGTYLVSLFAATAKTLAFGANDFREFAREYNALMV